MVVGGVVCLKVDGVKDEATFFRPLLYHFGVVESDLAIMYIRKDATTIRAYQQLFTARTEDIGLHCAECHQDGYRTQMVGVRLLGQESAPSSLPDILEGLLADFRVMPQSNKGFSAPAVVGMFTHPHANELAFRNSLADYVASLATGNPQVVTAVPHPQQQDAHPLLVVRRATLDEKANNIGFPTYRLW